MTTNPNPLIYFALERESIRKKKEAGLPAPWTEDPILQTYRFCNVRREDDRVSRWLIAHVLKQEYIDADLPSFLMFSAFCRWVNWPPSIQAVLDAGLYPSKEPDWLAIGDVVDARQKTGVKAWTGAYMVRAKPGDNPKRGKGRFVAEDVIQKSLGHVIPIIIQSLRYPMREPIWYMLQSGMNWGSFMAGQVVADWGYTPLLRNAPDTYTWAPVGPGSKRGFNRLLGRRLNQKIALNEWSAQLIAWRKELVDALGPGYEGLTLHDVQNCLCEVDKYLRVKTGQGRPRSKYKPETAF